MNMRPTDLQIAKRAGNILQGWREDNGLSKYAFGKLTGLRQETITKVEDGDARMLSYLTYLDYIRKLDTPAQYHLIVRLIHNM